MTLRLLGDPRPLRFRELVLKDYGHEVNLCLLSNELKLNDELVLSIDNVVVCNFFVYCITSFALKCKLSILKKLHEVQIKKSFRAHSSLREILSISGLPIESTLNFGVANFGFAGSGLEFMHFLCSQFKLRIFLKNEKIILYQKPLELNLGTQNLPLYENNKVKLNLQLRALSGVNDMTLEKVIHKADENISILKLKQELKWTATYF